MEASSRKRLVRLAFALILASGSPSILNSVESAADQQTPDPAAPEETRWREELNAARQLAAAGRIEAAAAGYRRILMTDPASFEAHFELAQILMSQQNLDEARVQLVEAVNLRPGNGPANVRLAQMALQLDDMALAEKALVAARKIDPQEASVRYNLGRVYEKLGQDESALEEYLAFLKLAPRDPRANNIRARVALFYENAQQLDAAVDMYRELIVSDPSRATAHLALAGIHYRRARYDDALPEYEEVLRLDPSNAAAHANIGFINRIKGRLGEAVAHFTRAVEIDPTDISSLHFRVLYTDRAIIAPRSSAPQWKASPPSTLMVCPVMKAESSEARKTTVPTRSFGSSARFRHSILIIASFCSGVTGPVGWMVLIWRSTPITSGQNLSIDHL